MEDKRPLNTFFQYATIGSSDPSTLIELQSSSQIGINLKSKSFKSLISFAIFDQ